MKTSINFPPNLHMKSSIYKLQQGWEQSNNQKKKAIFCDFYLILYFKDPLAPNVTNIFHFNLLLEGLTSISPSSVK